MNRYPHCPVTPRTAPTASPAIKILVHNLEFGRAPDQQPHNYARRQHPAHMDAHAYLHAHAVAYSYANADRHADAHTYAYLHAHAVAHQHAHAR